MSIVKMKKLQLFAIRSQKEELLKELMMLGCVEVTEAPSSGETETGALRQETSLLPDYRTQHAQHREPAQPPEQKRTSARNAEKALKKHGGQPVPPERQKRPQANMRREQGSKAFSWCFLP